MVIHKFVWLEGTFFQRSLSIKLIRTSTYLFFPNLTILTIFYSMSSKLNTNFVEKILTVASVAYC